MPIMYSTPWCGYCHRLKGQLKRAGIEFAEVDIEQEPDAAKIRAMVAGSNAASVRPRRGANRA